MEKKSKLCVIGFVFAMAALLLLILSLIPMERIRTTSLYFYGFINLFMDILALACAITAVVLGAKGRKAAEKHSMATAALVIGIISIIFSVFFSMGNCACAMFTDYANNGSNSFIGKNISEKDRREIDRAIDEVFSENGVKTTSSRK